MKYECTVCGWIYDEEVGVPEEGIAPGTKFEDLPEDFACELHDAVIINGDGAHEELLLEEGLDSADAFVSLTGMDEENILVSCFAKAHKVPTIITKIKNNVAFLS